MIRCWSIWILVFWTLDNVVVVVEGQQCVNGTYLETVGNPYSQFISGNTLYSTRIILSGSGSYTFSNIDKVNILVVGGGGAGGGGQNNNPIVVGGGGGAGDCKEIFDISLNTNKVISWTVGNAAASRSANSGYSGETTSATVGGTTYTASGGGGGGGWFSAGSAGASGGGASNIHSGNTVRVGGAATVEGVTGYSGCSSAYTNGGGGGGKRGACIGTDKTAGAGMNSTLITGTILTVCGGGTGGSNTGTSGFTPTSGYGWGGNGFNAIVSSGTGAGGPGGQPAVFVNYACTILSEITCPNNTQSRVGATSLSECTPIAGYYGPAGSVPSLCPSNFYCPAGSTSPVPCSVCAGPVSRACNSSNDVVCKVCESGLSAMSGSCVRKIVYTFTGSVQTFVVPIGVRYLISKMWGGGGGGASSRDFSIANGGSGGYSYGKVPVSSGQLVYVVVGQGGTARIGEHYQLSNYPWPNGGKGITGYVAASGAGRSQISIFDTAQSNLNAAIRQSANIRMVAGGGGGGAIGIILGGGGGGGLTGNSTGNSFPGTQSNSGTCSSGCSCTFNGNTINIIGSFLQAGHGCANGGGGGDGWYGGSGGRSNAIGSGGGGSGYLHSSVLDGITETGGNGAEIPFNFDDADNQNRYGRGGYATNLVSSLAIEEIYYLNGVTFGQNGLVVLAYECDSDYIFNSSSLQCQLRCPIPGTFYDGIGCDYPVNVNFSVNTSNLSFSVNDLVSYMAQRKDLGLKINFTFTQKSNVFVEAQACPAGYVCPVDSLAGIACVKGTYNNQTNAFASSQCTTCPVGFYCPVASVNPTRCPDYTTSVEGQDSVLQCTCLAGFYCKYAKRIYGRVTLNISAAAFDASMQSNFRKAIAAAAGVTESDVLILSVNSGTGGGGSRRRMLSLGSSLLEEQGKPFGESFMDVHIQVLNAEGLRDIKKHVDLHCGAGYHVDHEWRENHGVVAVPSLS
jgi:hypothetical protein